MTNNKVMLDRNSMASLKVELYFDDEFLASGTSYVDLIDQKNYLVTNRHIVTGRNPLTGKAMHPKLALPNRMIVYHNAKDQLGGYVRVKLDLYNDSSQSNYLVSSEQHIDVALLPLSDNKLTETYPVEFTGRLSTADVRILPTCPTAIVGFPFGLTTSAFLPIWKTGSVASDVDVPFAGLPCVAIDAATRGGMSGSPVYALPGSSYRKRSTNNLHMGSPQKIFMGTYSGRMHIPEHHLEGLDETDKKLLLSLGSDIGMVWKESINQEISKNGTRLLQE